MECQALPAYDPGHKVGRLGQGWSLARPKLPLKSPGWQCLSECPRVVGVELCCVCDEGEEVGCPEGWVDLSNREEEDD